MKSVSFKKDLLSIQEELLLFAYKLTADKEEANDLLQETSLKADVYNYLVNSTGIFLEAKNSHI